MLREKQETSDAINELLSAEGSRYLGEWRSVVVCRVTQPVARKRETEREREKKKRERERQRERLTCSTNAFWFCFLCMTSKKRACVYICGLTFTNSSSLIHNHSTYTQKKIIILSLYIILIIVLKLFPLYNCHNFKIVHTNKYKLNTTQRDLINSE